jgi:hypothetical protein
MPFWVFECDSCKADFNRSEITEDELRALAGPSKPSFPVGGKQLVCPHCGTAGIYNRTDFIYRA